MSKKTALGKGGRPAGVPASPRRRVPGKTSQGSPPSDPADSREAVSAKGVGSGREVRTKGSGKDGGSASPARGSALPSAAPGETSSAARTVAAKRRNRKHVYPKTFVKAELTRASMRVAIRSLLELATAYDAAEPESDFRDVGARPVDEVLGTNSLLHEIVNRVREYDTRRQEHAEAFDVFTSKIPIMVRWLKDPKTAKLSQTPSTGLTCAIGLPVSSCQVPHCPPVELDEDPCTRGVPQTYRTPSLRRGPAALRDDLIRILWKENAQEDAEVLTRGSEALENYNSALTGPGGRGAVKTRPQALALQNDDRLRDEELYHVRAQDDHLGGGAPSWQGSAR